MKISYSYLPRQFSDCDDIWQKIRELVIQGDFTLGAHVARFEEDFAKLIGTRYAIGVGSGTDALFLSLKALDIGPGDEVITSTNTFVATAGAIETAGAKIVFVDCNEKYVIDAAKLEAAITPNTKAIIPVHFSGQPAEMDRILSIAKQYDLKVIEDACCAIDAHYKGQRAGTMGILNAFSLHPLKNLNIWGDGGVITTNSTELATKLQLMRNHGMLDRDTYSFYAYNSRLDTIQAVVAQHLIGEVTNITNQRIKWAQTFDTAFNDLSERIYIPERDPEERHVYHMYMMLVEKRDQLNCYLQDSGIESKIHYPVPLHLQPASAKLGYTTGNFPVAEKQAKSIISLPVHQHLNEAEVNYMIEKVRAFYSTR